MPIVLYAQWAGSLSYSPLSKTMGWQGVALLSDTAHCQRAGSQGVALLSYTAHCLV